MIITRTPLRITLGGGGTDIPAWYEKHGSTFISAAIDKYVYVTYYRTPFFPDIHLKYSETETVKHIDDIKNGIIRETLRYYNIKDHVEIVSHADIPSGTGLGSSGSFGVGLCNALKPLDPALLAMGATRIQKDILKYPIGLQDQYVAAFGGARVYKIAHGRITSSHLKTDLKELEKHLVLFYTGFKRDANEVLAKQKLDLGVIQDIGLRSQDALEQGDFNLFGELMDEHWQYKKTLGEMSNQDINYWYALALNNGAIGGKLVGAGGGGFLLFVTEERERLIKALPLQVIPFSFVNEGSKVIYNDQDLR